jgi:hypothetical protein
MHGRCFVSWMKHSRAFTGIKKRRPLSSTGYKLTSQHTGHMQTSHGLLLYSVTPTCQSDIIGPVWFVSYLTLRDSSRKMSTLQNKVNYRMAFIAYWSNAKTLFSTGQYGICVQWRRTTLYLSFPPLMDSSQVPLGETIHSVWSSVVWIHIMFLLCNAFNVKAFAFFKSEKLWSDSTTNIAGSFLKFAFTDRILGVVVT